MRSNVNVLFCQSGACGARFSGPHLSVKKWGKAVVLVAQGKEEPRENSRRVFLPLPPDPVPCRLIHPALLNPSSSVPASSRAGAGTPPLLNTLTPVNFRSIELWSRMQLRFESDARVAGAGTRPIGSLWACGYLISAADSAREIWRSFFSRGFWRSKRHRLIGGVRFAVFAYQHMHPRRCTTARLFISLTKLGLHTWCWNGYAGLRLPC